MRHLLFTAAVLVMPIAPAAAQDTSKTDEGFSLMEEGARMLMRGLMKEMEPAISDMRDAFEEMGPAFAEFAGTVGPAFASLLEQVDDIRNYDAPVFLPNGDIIMRRRPDAPAWMPPADDGAEIDL